MGRGQPRDCAMEKWRLFDRGQRWFHPGERRAGLSPACLNTGCEACAHARGCEQLLLSSIFLFCCLALSLSVFLASKCERCWGRWRWIWGFQTSLSGRARTRSAWHSPREGFIVSRQLHVLRQNRRECRWRIKLPSNPLESLCTASCAAVATVDHEWKIFTAVAIVGLHRDNDLTGSVDPAQCCTLHAACDGPVILQSIWTCRKNGRSGNGNGLELSERREKHHFFPSKRNKEQTRHVLVGTINFHLMLVAIRNLVELVRSRRRLGGVSYTPVEGPISFNGGRERRFLVEQKVDVCFLLSSDSLVHVSFV